MTDLRDRVLAAIEDADEPLSVLQLAGALNTTIWQINRCVNTLELAGDIVVDHRSHGVNRVATADDDLVADGGCEQHRVAEETTALEVLEHIPTNTETIPMRQWIAGDRESDEISVDEFVTGLLWSDHAVALGGCLPDEEQGWAYYVDHTGDLRMWVPGMEIRESGEAREELADDLGNNKIRVVAMLTKDQPDPVKAVGKEIVTDGGQLTDNAIIGYVVGPSDDAVTVCTECAEPDEDTQAIHDSEVYGDQVPYPECWVCQQLMRPETADTDDDIVTDGGERVSDPGARVYCPNCKQWNSHTDGDCSICGETIKQAVTDGGRPPLRRCPDCGLIHRATGACRAPNRGGD